MLGVPVFAADARSTLDAIRGYLADPWDGVCRHVATVNPEYVMAARSDPAFASALTNTDLNTIDGVGVLAAVWLRRRDGTNPFERLTGVQIVEMLAATSAQDDAPIFLLGAGPGVAEETRDVLLARSPVGRVVGTWDGGSPLAADDLESLRRIAASGAKTVLVAYGASGQVRWIERNRNDLARCGVRLAIGVGGALDMISGRTPRPPHIVRRIGLEWLYRLLTEPWRWRRQLALPRFAGLVLWERIRHRT